VKKYIFKFWIILLLLFCFNKSNAQIGDIKDLAGGAADLFSGCASSDLSAGCDAYYCCWNGGFHFFDFLIEHNKEIMQMKYLDPCLLSLEIDANAAYSVHYNPDSSRYYHYINYLPHIKCNLGIVSLDYRYNLLTEYVNDMPDTYKSWDLIMMLNFVPTDGVKISLGSGVYTETFTEKYYNEHYFFMQFGILENKDFLEIDTRVAVDYYTSLFPFIEAGMRYKLRMMEMPHVYGYLSLGGFFQAYYSEHQIYGLNAGLLFNIH